jgi:alginate O-acetyltransferase complex protein AlgI
MSYISAAFIIFTTAALLLYYLLPKKARWVLLLAASYVFYLYGGYKAGAYILFTTVTTYTAGRLLSNLNAQRRSLSKDSKDRLNKIKNRKRLLVFAAVFLNFGLLYVLKYWNFTAESLYKLSPVLKLPYSNLAVPLGISFYIFQSVGYVIDVYRDKFEAQKNFFKYALFVSFFPQLIQGPIGRYDHLAAQLYEERSLDFRNIKFGLQLAMWGLFKKLVIADRAGVIVNTVFNNSGAYSGSVTAFAVLLYCIQLYCDFSGGIDIIRGVARLFGIDMAENFRRPIFATSLTDYWRRWHISLGSWMRDYLFYPLSLSKPFGKLGKFTRKHIGGVLGKILPTSLATFIVYFVIGIWHGANFRYIAFGLWNGIIITSSLLLDSFYAKVRGRLGLKEDNRGLYVFRILRTSFLVFLGRYITRAPRLLTAFSMLKTTFLRFQPEKLLDGSLLKLGLDINGLIIVFAGMAVVLAVEIYQERGGRVRETLEKKSFFVQWLFILVPLAVIILLGILDQTFIAAQFIYAQF